MEEKVKKVKAPPAAKASAVKSAKADAGSAGKAEHKPRMRERYRAEIVPALVKKFALKNVNEAPRLEKIVLNMRLGDIKDNTKSMNGAVEELRQISGQKPVTTKAKKSLSNWKIREGMAIGAKVTLRGDRMYDFFDKLLSIGLPRVRDFKGVSPKSFDGKGNYSLGIKEQLIFPEISFEQVEKVRGFDICITTTARTDEHAKELLRLFGMPFKAN
jgi:large subunit ribosomal protein L5